MSLQFKLDAKVRTFAILVFSYGFLMMHFVYSRAFRDSLLGGKVQAGDLPRLTLVGTLLAITVSVVMSFFLRSDGRVHIIRLFYLMNATVEIVIALSYKSHSWMYSCYYIVVSTSTAIGLSLIWVLIGDWTSKCNARDTNKVSLILLTGTAAGMFAGLCLVRLPSASDFKESNLLLAGMNVAVVIALLFHRDSFCISQPQSPFEDFSVFRRRWALSVVQALAVVTVVGATASTMLDLLFRVRVSEHFTSQPDRLHFLGFFQGFLCLGALASQLGIRSLIQQKLGCDSLTIHPTALFAASVVAAFFPGFWVIALLRGGEYSLRNSVFRCGSEMIYAALPDKLRVEVRPPLDVVGERLGDMAAAGLLALLLMRGRAVADRWSFCVLAFVSLILWRCCYKLLRRTQSISEPVSTESGGDMVTLDDIAGEKSVMA